MTTPLSALTPSTPSAMTPGDVVQSHGQSLGQVIAALICLTQNINTQQFGNDLQVLFSKLAAALANIEAALQAQESTLQQNAWNNDKMNQVQSDIQNGSFGGDDQYDLQDYSTDLGAIQAALSAGLKELDAIATPAQNMPSAISTAMNQIMTDIASVLQGLSFQASHTITS